MKFYADNWSTKIALADGKFYEWLFINNPNSEESDYCVVAYDNNLKEVLGVMGLNKRDFYLNNNTRVRN